MATDPRRLAGIATITVDGRQYMLQGSLEYQVSKVKRETLTGQDDVHGFSEMPSAGRIKGTFRDAQSVSLAALNKITGATVICVLANGKTILGRNMWTLDVQSVNTQEATFEIEFNGPSVEEV